MPLALFYSFVTAYNSNNTAGRFNSRSLLSRYIGPARQHGVGAIRVHIDHTVRVVRTWRFIPAPDAEVGPTTLRVTPTRTSTLGKTTPQRGQSNTEDTGPSITTSTTPGMRSVRLAPTREQIRTATGRAGAAIAPSHDLNDDEPRRSWYISRPRTIPSEFRPRNVK